MTGADWQEAGFGLYLHWPFCQAKCPYCDFNSHVAAEIDESRWNRAFLAEIDRLGEETRGRTLSTVFFGGGTPSLMDPGLVADILSRIRATWPMANDPEITLEANPTSVEAGRFRAVAGNHGVPGSDRRELVRIEDGGALSEELQSVVPAAVDLDPTFSLERLEVGVGGGGESEAQALGDLGARRRHAPTLEVAADAVENLLLAVRELVCAHFFRICP